MDVDQNYSLIEQISTDPRDIDHETLQALCWKIVEIGTRLDSCNKDFMRAATAAHEYVSLHQLDILNEHLQALIPKLIYPIMQDNHALTNNPDQ